MNSEHGSISMSKGYFHTTKFLQKKKLEKLSQMKSLKSEKPKSLGASVNHSGVLTTEIL